MIAVRTCGDRPAAARDVLRDAVASRNSSTDDAHLLARGWVLDADLRTHDRDLAGTGWPSWSNGDLARALGAGATDQLR